VKFEKVISTARPYQPAGAVVHAGRNVSVQPQGTADLQGPPPPFEFLILKPMAFCRDLETATESFGNEANRCIYTHYELEFCTDHLTGLLGTSLIFLPGMSLIY
jgi:hypothetical protein